VSESTSIRSSSVARGHSPWSKARRAAATAASTSAVEAAGTRASASPLKGEVTVSVLLPRGAIQRPPMKTAE
jgi:hypothetical protein